MKILPNINFFSYLSHWLILIRHLLVFSTYSIAMKTMILITGFGLYIVLTLFVLVSDWNIFCRLIALFIFPFLLHTIFIYPKMSRVIRIAKKKKAARSLSDEPEITLSMAYRILDLPRNATSDQVNQQYRRLIHIVHPDAGGVTHLAKLLNEAKNIIISHPSNSKKI